jgi:DNA-binding beta-propeller fold protein YncE
MTRVMLLSLLALAGIARAAPPQPAWTATGFANPDAVVYASQQKLIYVSNVNGEPNARDGNGFISQLGLDGKLVRRQWLKGLHAPKGLGYYHGWLYVADLDELLEVDTGNGHIRRRFKAPGAQALTGVAVSSGGTVFVSDASGNALWRLQGNALELWLRDEALQNPNGLLFDKGQLLVASAATGNETGGYLQAVDLASKVVSARFAPIPLGRLDGIASDGKGGYAVSDFVRGNVFRINAGGQPELWLQVTPGTAALGAAPGLLLVPQRNENTVAAYPLK